MKKSAANLRVAALAIGLLAGASGMAQALAPGELVTTKACNARVGNAKAICLKAAKANQQTAQLHNNAAAEKLETKHLLENDKCDAFAFDAKDNCQAQVEASFGKF